MVLRASQQPLGSVGILSCYAVPLWDVRDFVSFSPSSPAGALPSVMIKSPPGYWVNPQPQVPLRDFLRGRKSSWGSSGKPSTSSTALGSTSPTRCLSHSAFCLRVQQEPGREPGALCRRVLYIQTPSESSFLPAA